MSLFVVDLDKCNKDGLCAAECPAGCIVFEKGAFPVPHEKKQDYCINCGHCMAVCPTGALQLDSFPSPCIPKDKELNISYEEAEQFLRMRRSLRSFRDKPVEREQVERLLSLTEYAPSGHNARLLQWRVADTPEKVAKVARAIIDWMARAVEADLPVAKVMHMAGIVRAYEEGIDIVCRSAPMLAVAIGPQEGITPKEDAVAAATYLELAAAADGLGACWSGFLVAAATHDEAVKEVLGVPDGHAVYAAIMLGHPMRKYRSAPPRSAPVIEWL